MDDVDESVDGTCANTNDQLNGCPQLGMEFDTTETAWEFWKKYGKGMGFGVRKVYSNKNKDGVITSCMFVCNKQGLREEDKRAKGVVQHRWEVRTDCKVTLNIVLERKSGKYKVRKFFGEHNHALEPNETRHMFRSYRCVSEGQALAIGFACNAGITPTAAHELMSKEAGGRVNLRYITDDQTTYLRSRREKNMKYGELGSIMRYFAQQKSKDSLFHHSEQYDKDELVTNIFWVDAQMLVDCEAFGDVVTFDTTYGTNRKLRPLGVFAGVNHHKEIVIFGAALLYDETIESFKWLFETFVNAHGGKRPRTVFTDQDAAMANALTAVLPDTHHGLCTWHLMQNAVKHLACNTNSSTILNDISRCMYGCETEMAFENTWQKMLEGNSLQDKNWLKELFGLRMKWAKCFMKHQVTLGIRSTQICERLNRDFKAYLKRDLNIEEFFVQFDRVLRQKREKELESEFYARQRVPSLDFDESPLLLQASRRYTPNIFELFKKEYSRASRTILKTIDERENVCSYVIGLHGSNDDDFQVIWVPNDHSISCSCLKFESNGYLCCHAIKILKRHCVMEIPARYILNRWTRTAKSSHVLHEERVNVDCDVNQWIRRIQSQLVRMTFQASTNEVTRNSMERMIHEYSRQLSDFVMRNEVAEEHDLVQNVEQAMQNRKGLKKRGFFALSEYL